MQAGTAPANVDRGSFSYDPNSIDQNERILRLLLHLASETADRLIRLKNDAEERQREESAIRSKARVPEFRMKLPDNGSTERFASSDYQDNSESPRNNEKLDNGTVRYGQLSLDRFTTGKGLADRVYGPYIPATEDSLIGGYYFRNNRGSNITGTGENPRSINDSAELTEIQSRMMFDVDHNDTRNTTDAPNLLGEQNSTAGAVISNQTMGEDPNHETRSEGTTSAVDSFLGDQNATEGAVVSSQTMSEDSDHEIGSDETSAVGNSSGDVGSTARATIANEPMTAPSNLQSASVGLISSVQSAGSDSQSAGKGTTPDRTVSAGSAMHSSSSGRLVPAASRNQVSQIMSSIAGDRRHQAEAIGDVALDSSKSEAILSNADLPTILANRGSSVRNTSKTVSVIKNVVTGLSDEGARVTNSAGSDVLRKTPNIAIVSVAGGQTQRVAQPLEGFADAGSKLTGSLFLKHGAGTGKTTIVSSSRRGNSAYAPLGTNSGGASQEGPSLMGTSPLFRSFPDHGDRSYGVEFSPTNSEKSFNDVPSKSAEDSLTGHGNGFTGRPSEDQHSREDWDGGVSEVELNKYANRFANALRPVRTKT